jgi:hypothetical protein
MAISGEGLVKIALVTNDHLDGRWWDINWRRHRLGRNRLRIDYRRRRAAIHVSGASREACK